MSINPANITTTRVGQLPDAPWSLTDQLPHEVGTDLKRGTVQGLADLIGGYIGASSSVAFRAVTVADGGTLPDTTQEEWILVGSGTFYNVNGGATIVCTEELNALISNGTFWSIGVEINISADLIGITQLIRSGYFQTAPSENAVFDALALKANLTDIPASLPKMYFVADGMATSFDTGVNAQITAIFEEGALIDDNDWSQSGSIFTLTYIVESGRRIKPV